MCINELDSCTSSTMLAADMATVRDSCQGAGNLAIPDDPIVKLVASWNLFI